MLRLTRTDLPTRAESEIHDYWTSEDASTKELSSAWTGSTTFQILKPTPKDGYYYVQGRLTRRQQTNRPDHIIPEVWTNLTEKQQKKEIEFWKVEGPKRIAERQKRGIDKIEPANRSWFWASGLLIREFLVGIYTSASRITT